MQVDVVDAEDVRSGFRIVLSFVENPWFHDAELTKVFTWGADGAGCTIQATEPQWKEEAVVDDDGNSIGGAAGRAELENQGCGPARPPAAVRALVGLTQAG